MLAGVADFLSLAMIGIAFGNLTSVPMRTGAGGDAEPRTGVHRAREIPEVLAKPRRFLRRHAAMRRILFFPSLQPILPTEP